jgi:hypothetical protein
MVSATCLPDGAKAKDATPSGEAFGFSAFHGDPVELTLAVAVGDERDPLAVGRPRRLHARSARVGQLPRLPRRRVSKPDLGFVGVLVPVRLSNRERHVLAARRDRRRGDALEIDQIVDGGRRRALRQDGRCREKQESKECPHVSSSL